MGGGGACKRAREARVPMKGLNIIFILKSRGSEMVFSALSMRYFFKKNVPALQLMLRVST